MVSVMRRKRAMRNCLLHFSQRSGRKSRNSVSRWQASISSFALRIRIILHLQALRLPRVVGFFPSKWLVCFSPDIFSSGICIPPNVRGNVSSVRIQLLAVTLAEPPLQPLPHPASGESSRTSLPLPQHYSATKPRPLRAERYSRLRG